MKKLISIEEFEEFLKWASINEYLFSTSMSFNSGWLHRDEIRNIKSFDERDKAKRSTETLYNEYMEIIKRKREWLDNYNKEWENS